MKKISKMRKIFLFTFLFILISIFTSVGYFYYKLSGITDNNTTIDSLENTNDYKVVDGVNNILLVGVDARNLEELSRSDAMMILTVDNNSKSIKMTSLARDTYVNIPEHGMEKLTHAYAYGGINLLIETIESNFELDINHYSIVNFNSFVDIVDAIGGVEVNVKNKDIKELNNIIKDSYIFKNNNKNNKEDIEFIEDSGVQQLNGYQALAYSRIRKHDSAFNRDERQREVLQSLIVELKKLPITKYNSLLNAILPNIKTDMLPKDILNLGFTMLSMNDLDIDKIEFPLLNYSDGRIRGKDGWVLDFKRELCLKVLHDFIFEDISYSDEDLVDLDKNIDSSYNSKYYELINKYNKGTIIEDTIDKDYDNYNDYFEDFYIEEDIQIENDTNFEDSYMEENAQIKNDFNFDEDVYFEDNISNENSKYDNNISEPLIPELPVEPTIPIE